MIASFLRFLRGKARRAPPAQPGAELAALRAQIGAMQARFDLIRQATSDGLWDMEICSPDPIDGDNPFWWSDQFRRLLGYSDERDFPNVLRSWSSRLHPDDAGPTLVAFAAHVHDRTGRTPYDVTYRLKCRNGEYRWFRAQGKTIRAPDGTPQRVAGALTDLTDRNAILGLKRFSEDIIANLPVGLIVADESLRIIRVNRAFLEIFGMQQEGSALARALDAVFRNDALREEAQRVLRDESTRQGIATEWGGKRLRVALAGIRDAEERRRLLVMTEDVTEKQRLREEARAHVARQRDQLSLLDKATDAILVRGIDHRIQFWNKSAERLYGWTSKEVLGRSEVELLYDEPSQFATLTDELLEHDEWRGELMHRRKDGSSFAVESHWTLVRSEDHQPQSVLVINTDITQRKATAEKIEYLALYDMLTGLPNRRLFADRVEQALMNAQRHRRTLAVMFMDLNRFKEINDTRGHGVGDQVLVKVATRLRAALRGDETLARLAGDEFVVVAQTDDAHAGILIAERLEQALTDPVVTSGGTFSVGVSIGIAFYPSDGTTSEDLLKCADIAMYRAKATGAGHICYRPEMGSELAERMELARKLQRALSEDKLELHYQPKVCLRTGKLVGAEALLRWHDPERGWISPATFIPVAEARDIIGVLGKWVLRQACRQLKAWQDADLASPGRLAVNVSARQLDEAGVADSIQAIVREEGLAPSDLELELTESGVMHHVERAIEIMKTLKRAGFALTIDDFGTGYSSLSYLKRLPVDKLKIDMAFVRDMLKDHHDRTIVTTIIGMARNLDLDVIAEGVEEAAQADTLRAMGCDEAQGFYFGRPVTAEVFAQQWLTPAMQAVCLE
ncbi:EAL domain-containing protein [Massilia solisilvae]|uniref:EAL domain-containing protein n=1 Tax=Massilia solisilvae TaxID=1811225 RepID=A0ABT2BGP8_9BURK|nr:EAL domain-containing protein [Massilia solisilvae]